MKPSELCPWLVTDGDEQAPAADRAPVPALPAVSAVPKLALTARELAAALGVSPSTVAGWLRAGADTLGAIILFAILIGMIVNVCPDVVEKCF